MVSRENLRQLSKWAGFVGIITIIGGVISAILGLFSFIIGAIPGIISIVLGVKLRNAKKYADELIMSNVENQDSQMNQIFINLITYFKIQGVLIIIGFILIGVGLLLGGISAFSF